MGEAMNQSRQAGESRQFLGHPWPLSTLFGMEVWERFSFYGMQAILLIYLYYESARGGLGIAESAAFGIVGAYGSSVYLATILGGWFADRILGPERTLFYSGAIVMAGHIALALVPGVPGVTLGLCLVALGSGGVKATCAALVGSLYAPGSPKRDAGFSIFYLGINLGGFAGPLLTGYLQSSAGFHYGFGIAAIGMALGLIQYAFGRRHLAEAQRHPPMPLAAGEAKRYLFGAIVAVALLAAALVFGWLRADTLTDVILGVIVVTTLAYFVVILRSARVSALERRRVLAFVPLFIASAVYWALYVQSYTVIVAFFDQRVDRQLGGWTIPVGWLTSVQALTIILLSGVFAWLWSRLGQRQPSSAAKFVIAMLVIGASFFGYLPWLGADAAGMPLWVLVALLLGFTVSELCLSPIGLSVTTRLAPRAMQTQMIALFYLSLSLGFAAGGRAGEWYTQRTEVVYFITLGTVSLIAGVLLAFCLPAIRRASAGTE